MVSGANGVRYDVVSDVRASAWTLYFAWIMIPALYIMLLLLSYHPPPFRTCHLCCYPIVSASSSENPLLLSLPFRLNCMKTSLLPACFSLTMSVFLLYAILSLGPRLNSRQMVFISCAVCSVFFTLPSLHVFFLFMLYVRRTGTGIYFDYTWLRVCILRSRTAC